MIRGYIVKLRYLTTSTSQHNISENEIVTSQSSSQPQNISSTRELSSYLTIAAIIVVIILIVCLLYGAFTQDLTNDSTLVIYPSDYDHRKRRLQKNRRMLNKNNIDGQRIPHPSSSYYNTDTSVTIQIRSHTPQLNNLYRSSYHRKIKSSSSPSPEPDFEQQYQSPRYIRKKKVQPEKIATTTTYPYMCQLPGTVMDEDNENDNDN